MNKYTLKNSKDIEQIKWEGEGFYIYNILDSQWEKPETLEALEAVRKSLPHWVKWLTKDDVLEWLD